jgi:hypothetical protein
MKSIFFLFILIPFILFGQTSSFYPYPWLPSLPGNQVAAMIQGKSGEVWVGTDQGGLYTFSGSVWTFIPLEFTSFSSQILSLYADPDGILWVGTSEGVSAISSDLPMKNLFDTELIHITEPIGAIEKGPLGSVWMEGKNHAYLWDGRHIWPFPSGWEKIISTGPFSNKPSPVLNSFRTWLEKKTASHQPHLAKEPTQKQLTLGHGFICQSQKQGLMVAPMVFTTPYLTHTYLTWLSPSLSRKEQTLKGSAIEILPFRQAGNLFPTTGTLRLVDIHGLEPFRFQRDRAQIICAPGTEALSLYFATLPPFHLDYDFFHYQLDHQDIQTFFPGEPLFIKNLAPGTYQLSVYGSNASGERSVAHNFTLLILHQWYEMKGFQLGFGSLLLACLGLFGVHVQRRRRTLKNEEKVLRQQLQTLTIDHIRHVLPSHLVGNAMQHLQALFIQKKYALAGRYMENMQDVFHYALENAMQTVSLSQEMDFIRYYFNIENLRMGALNQLHFERVQEEDLDHIHLPAMVTQPIIENAFKYAFSLANPGQLVWEVKSNGQQVLLICRCIASKNLHPTRSSKGKGLGLVKDQLLCIFPPPAQVEVSHFFESEQVYRTQVSFPKMESMV